MTLYDKTAFKSSKIITNSYSTSFSLGIKVLAKKFHYPIYAIYGFVRYADEIVDTFHEHDKSKLLSDFRNDTYAAIEAKLSLNPVLHAFQLIVNQYNIPFSYIDAFLDSMEMDLVKQDYDEKLYKKYIYGSAEVVGLMCLKVFCNGNEQRFNDLEAPARSLGAAFQKVNFLRDMKSDYDERGRVYFPEVDYNSFCLEDKNAIESDIENDFANAYDGIRNLPSDARLGVYIAFVYYVKLFNKIKISPVSNIVQERIRIPNKIKLWLLIRSYFKYQLKTI